NPSLGLILNYLRACGASWVEFFKELDALDFKQRHEKMMAKLLMGNKIGIQPRAKAQKKPDYN
ncbi:MAG: hypothetical protein ABIK67_07910, partial [candidate division WOR-3 bacterium]